MMQNSVLSSESKIARPLLFGLFLMGGLLVFLFGSNTFRLFPTNKNLLYDWILTLVLLVVAVFLRRSDRLQKYWGAAFALFIAAFANAFNGYLGTWLEHLLPAAVTTAQTLAIDKLSQAIPILLAIVLLTLLAGDDLGSIFLKKGDLRQGLKFGLISFGDFTVIFALIAVLQSNDPASQGLTAAGISLDTLVAAIPFILIFVFANSLMEELWFRGIFLRKLGPLLGLTGSILVTALVFGISHLGATYISPLEMIIFPLIVITLGLVNAYVMLKTDSIWGSMLFHAGYDLIVIIPILATL